MMTRPRFATSPRPSALAARVASFTLLLVFAISVCGTPQQVVAQEKLTSKQTRVIKQIGKSIDRAGKLYTNKKLEASAKLVQQASELMQKLVADEPNVVLLAAVKPEHDRLVKAREALSQAGQSMSAIADLPTVAIDPTAAVSFKGEISSILNNNCGRCHVQGTRGQFSMASYNSLMQGVGGAPVVVPSKDDESRLIEVIEEGSMPPTGTVPAEQLARLKKWIAEGAKFDGDDQTAGLAEMASANMAMGEQPVERLAMQRPTGSETVSFAMDVAPVLINNCTGCHFEARNARGGLRIDNFRQFLNGGDSGAMIKPGEGAESLLIKRLTAPNRREQMPLGRPALSAEVIAKIVKWIDEGARFDGRAERMNMREVAAIASSEAATHDDLMAQRHSYAKRDWNKVMSKADADLVVGNDVFVIGDQGSEKLEPLQKYIDMLAKKLKEKLNFSSKDPLVKGQISVFVFDRRYDYSEFGKMIEERDLPKAWRSHWGYDTVDAYMAVLHGDDSLSILKPGLSQRIAAVAVASLSGDVPSWFSDGYGYWLTEQVLDDQETIKKWKDRAGVLIGEMQNGTEFLQGRLPDDDSGLIAYGFVAYLQDADTKNFDKFVKAIREGQAFNEAFAEVYSVTPVDMIRQMTGQRPRRGNRRRNQG